MWRGCGDMQPIKLPFRCGLTAVARTVGGYSSEAHAFESCRALFKAERERLAARLAERNVALPQTTAPERFPP
jgi:hypothetical protein